MSNGKGRGPEKGRNNELFRDNYDGIFRKESKPNRLKPMKTNQNGIENPPATQSQPSAQEKGTQ